MELVELDLLDVISGSFAVDRELPADNLDDFSTAALSEFVGGFADVEARGVEH